MAGLTATLFALDTATHSEIAVACLYTVVVLLASRVYGERGILLVGAGCLGLALVSSIVTVDYDTRIGFINLCISAITISVVTLLLMLGKAAEEARQRVEERLQIAEANLSRYNRISLLSEVTASIGHEIKQPLAAIVANSQAASRWLAAEPLNAGEVRGSIARVLRDADRAEAIVDRIVRLARNQPPRKEQSDVNGLIEDVLLLQQTALRKEGVTLRKELSSPLPQVTADRVQLQQVLMNLANNAIEAMRETNSRARELTIASRLGEEGGVIIEVSDTGVGFAKAEPQRLFTSFYTTKPEGMGMGLAISRSIIESHGGALEALQREPHGAVLRISLPVRMPERAFVAKSPARGRAEG